MMVRRVLTTELLICGWCVVFALSGCSQLITSPEQPIYPVTTTHPVIPNKLPVTNTLQQDQTAETSPLPLSEQAESSLSWQSVSHSSGIAFQYPSDWQVDALGAQDPNSNHFMHLVHPANKEWSVSGVVIFGQPLPKQEESALCHQAGDVIAPENFLGPTIVVWHKSLIVKGMDWCLYIQGRAYDKTWDGLEYLEAKGAITVGTIIAVHYMDAKESYVTLSRELDREMLITLDRDGGDAVLGDYLQVFTEILSSITITH